MLRVEEIVVAAAAAATAAVIGGRLEPTPMWHTDEPDPVEVLLRPDTHPTRFHNEFRMNRECFVSLCQHLRHAIRPSERMMSHEKRVALTLIYYGKDASQRDEQEEVCLFFHHCSPQFFPGPRIRLHSFAGNP